MSSNSNVPLVSVGLPVYSRPRLLERALSSIINQSYANLEIIVSNDQSPNNEIRNVIDRFIERDSRIRYFFQERNLGHFENHRFVFNVAKGDLFFWASEDDEWHERFVEIGVNTLLENPSCEAWCCTLNNIDEGGEVIREYPGFSRFTTSKIKVRDLIKYLLESEVMGKANIFHGIFRRETLEKVIQNYFFGEVWGSDFCFNLAFLARYSLIGTDQILHYKRIFPKKGDEIDFVPNKIDSNLNAAIFPVKDSISYIREYDQAIRDTPYRLLVFTIMLYRVCNNFVKSHGSWKGVVYEVLYKGMIKKVWSSIFSVYRYFFYDNFWMRKFGYQNDSQTLDVRSSFVDTHGSIVVPINILRAVILTPDGKNLYKIDETPHFQLVSSLFEGILDGNSHRKYSEYIETYYPEENPNIELEHVVKLVESFKSTHVGENQISIVSYAPERDGESGYIVRIFDGIHRAAIATVLGDQSIHCRLIR